jgi:hypothetical protein
MSLSVCLMTGEPAGRVAAAVAAVRAMADEVVIAADCRVDARTLAGYAALADRLLRIELRFCERHLAWLHAQCSGDWILRLDGDEVVSGAFAGRLPELIASRKVQQYWVARAWLFPDAGTVLEDVPWSPDFDNRLVRNDGTLRFRGIAHSRADPVAPCEYVEEPVYELALLTTGVDERRDRAIRSEVARPRMIAPGGGRINEAFYLPELRASLTTRPLPEADRAVVARALAADAGVAEREPGPVSLVPSHEVDWHWEGREVPASAYRVAIEPVGAAPSLAPGEARRLPFRVANLGTEQWPWDLDRLPEIRVAYRWLRADGSEHTPDGQRTPFPRTVYPGDRVLVPVEVVAPPDPGAYLLEVDVVHERVRWFGQACRVPVAVEPSRALPPVETRVRETVPPRARRLRRLRIPRVLHRVWLGDAEMPEAHVEFGRTFERLHPGWEMRLWTDGALDALDITDSERARARSPAELSNVVRYEVLSRFGGVYVDTDVECRRCFHDLLRGVDAFTGLQPSGSVGAGVLGAVPGHRAFERAARVSRLTIGLGPSSAASSGPYFLGLILEQEPGVTVFGPGCFYPYNHDEPERAGEAFPGAYAVHHWSKSWWAAEGLS